MKKKKTFVESMEEQKHAGRVWSEVHQEYRPVYHTNSKGNYWLGYVFHDISPEELFQVSLSIVNDLLINHPELRLYNTKFQDKDENP